MEEFEYQIGPYINSNKTIWLILTFQVHDEDVAVPYFMIHLEKLLAVCFTTEVAVRVGTTTNSFSCLLRKMRRRLIR